MHCRAPGALAALDSDNSSFPVIAGWLWCYGHRYSIWRSLKQLWKKIRYGKTDCTFVAPTQAPTPQKTAQETYREFVESTASDEPGA
jgi:hypothetical protein